MYIHTYGVFKKVKKRTFQCMSSSVNYIILADVLLLYIDILTKNLLCFYTTLSKDKPE